MTRQRPASKEFEGTSHGYLTRYSTRYSTGVPYRDRGTPKGHSMGGSKGTALLLHGHSMGTQNGYSRGTPKGYSMGTPKGYSPTGRRRLNSPSAESICGCSAGCRASSSSAKLQSTPVSTESTPVGFREYPCGVPRELEQRTAAAGCAPKSTPVGFREYPCEYPEYPCGVPRELEQRKAAHKLLRVYSH